MPPAPDVPVRPGRACRPAGGGAIWVGRRALELLGSGAGVFTVTTSHGAGFWVLTPGGVVGLLRPPAPRGIRLIGLDATLPLPAVPPRGETAVTWDGSRLTWTAAGGVVAVCDLRAAPRWNPPPLEPPPLPPGGMGDRAARARRLLALLAPRPLDLPSEDVAALAAARGDEHALRAAVDRLAGRGGGLTPSGDDVLAGFAGLCPPALRTVLRRLFADAATTRLSRDLLMDACDGYLLEPAATFARWLLGEEGEPPAAILGRLVRIGHQSGLGLATGLLAAAAARAGDAAPAGGLDR
ncbi:MAG TPA: DUF2877 domain-containing protein [Bacillota bacterium]